MSSMAFQVQSGFSTRSQQACLGCCCTSRPWQPRSPVSLPGACCCQYQHLRANEHQAPHGVHITAPLTRISELISDQRLRPEVNKMGEGVQPDPDVACN